MKVNWRSNLLSQLDIYELIGLKVGHTIVRTPFSQRPGGLSLKKQIEAVPDFSFSKLYDLCSVISLAERLAYCPIDLFTDKLAILISIVFERHCGKPMGQLNMYLPTGHLLERFSLECRK